MYITRFSWFSPTQPLYNVLLISSISQKVDLRVNQSYLAKAIGVSPQYISKVLQGREYPQINHHYIAKMTANSAQLKIHTVELISKALNPPAEDFQGEYFSFDYQIDARANAEEKLFFMFATIGVRDMDKKQRIANFVVACVFQVSNFAEVIKSNENKSYSIFPLSHTPLQIHPPHPCPSNTSSPSTPFPHDRPFQSVSVFSPLPGHRVF